jgi:hypothetical protein
MFAHQRNVRIGFSLKVATCYCDNTTAQIVRLNENSCVEKYSDLNKVLVSDLSG